MASLLPKTELTRENPPMGRWNSIMVIRQLQIVRYKDVSVYTTTFCTHDDWWRIDGIGPHNSLGFRVFAVSDQTIRVPEILAVFLVGSLATLRVWPRPGMSLWRRVKNFSINGYRRNGEEHVVGRVKLDENIRKVLTCWTFSLVLCGNSTRAIRRSGALWLGTLEICLAKSARICVTWSWNIQNFYNMDETL